jgi:hypothetical protein
MLTFLGWIMGLVINLVIISVEMQEKAVYRGASTLSSRVWGDCWIVRAPASLLWLLRLVGQQVLHSVRGIFTVGKLLHITVNLLLCLAL